MGDGRWYGMVWDGMGWDGMGCDEMRWDGMGWEGMYVCCIETLSLCVEEGREGGDVGLYKSLLSN